MSKPLTVKDLMSDPLTVKGRNPVSPWAWIPTLYMAEGLPYIAVNVLTVLLYTQLGIPKFEMALYTGWLYLPWVIKPFWSPFVDIYSTKRRWTIAMQYLLALSMAGVAFLLPVNFFFSATLALFWIMALASATHDIAADGFYMLALNQKNQAAFVGVRSTFYRIANVLGQGGLVVLAGVLGERFGNPTQAWSVTFLILALFFLLIAIYHTRILPHPADDRPQVEGKGAILILKGFGEAFVTFFQKKSVWLALLFILLYRLPEALCLKLVAPFLVDSREAGGLGLSVTQIGVANGTVGVIALLAGGIVGGWAIARGGLRKWIWPMAFALTLPCALYCWLAMWQPDNFPVICVLIGIEQFGYGFGFTAFMMYLMYFSQGAMQTTHYAFCTAFMALGMMLPGMWAGWLHDLLVPLRLYPTELYPAGEDYKGYLNFFTVATLTSLISYLGTWAAYRSLKRMKEGES